MNNNVYNDFLDLLMLIGGLIITNFDFLKEKNDKLYKLGHDMETKIYSDPGSAVFKGNRLFEILLNLTFEESCVIDLPNKSNYAQRIDKLYEFRVIDHRTKDLFDRARRERNKGIHEDESYYRALKLNKILFNMCVWFFKKFYDFDSDNVIPSYKEPVLDLYASNHIPSDEKVSSDSEDNLNFNKQENLGHESNSNKLKANNFDKLNGSYLINELSKLSISSKHSVEDSGGLDNFKKYLHVEREIQKEFHDALVDAKDSDSNQLILLAGSVGDGKSHLLAYMVNEYPDIMKSFKIHNDATISFDPNLTAIDTLRDVLKPFNDENIGKSKDKIILAINLGIIRSLLDDVIFDKEFNKLKKILGNYDIFNSNFMDDKEVSSFLTVVNFADNHLYELNRNGVESEFLSELFDKIAYESPNNPFYKAYLKDKGENISNPVILNYEMFLNKAIRERVIDILLKYIIKNKKLLSVREIINFIYEILVPPSFNPNQDMANVSEYIDDLMPIMLYNTENRSKILQGIAKDSPINSRNEFLDEFLISLNTLDIKSFFKQYFVDFNEINHFLDYFLNLSKKDKQVIKDKLVFFAIFFGNEELIEAFDDKRYNDFLKYLYYYNYEPRKLNSLFNKIKNSIFKWKGLVKKNYILIDQIGDFKIGKRMDIEFKNDKSISNKDYKNKFKTEIQFKFLVNGFDCEEKCNPLCTLNKCIKLEIDYFLFDSIIKISEGYQPNKMEKQNLMVFDDFIKLLIQNNKNKEILVKDYKKEDVFKFKLSSNQYYTFERE